jgi:lactate racemase
MTDSPVTIRLAYGKTGIELAFPAERTTVVAPRHTAPAEDPFAAVRRAIRHPVAGPPLREVARRGKTVAIAVCDGTRPQPRAIVVPVILEELDGVIDIDDVAVLVATGTHRGNSADELREMLGDRVVNAVRVVNHDSRDDSALSWQGVHGAGVPVWLNREWIDADVRITTGFVEPHFFAGFSGGPKLVAPGLAALDTVLTLHDGSRIGHPNARWGVTEGNPVHDDVRAIAAATGVSFAVDVLIDDDHRITAAFGGELFAMHRAACALARDLAMAPVPRRYDVVVTSNAGFPLDQNLYQCVKGMSAAEQIVRPGGVIVCAAECRDGFPGTGEYRRQLHGFDSPEAFLAAMAAREKVLPDQWQLQIQARIQSFARVVMHTSLSDQDIASAGLEQTQDIDATVHEALASAGPGSTVCVLPQGPRTVPYIARP